MLKSFPFFVGYRYFRSGSSSNLVSFISFMAILGLALGVALLILVMSIMNGFESEMETKILGSVPHIQIGKKNGVEDLPKLINLVNADENVHAVMSFSKTDGMLLNSGVSLPIELLGIDLINSSEFVGNFLTKDLLSSLKKNGKDFLLAKGVAEKLSVQSGDTVALIVPQFESFNHTEFSPKIFSFKVGGIFITHTALDQKLVLGSLPSVNKIVGSFDAQGIQVKLNDIFSARETGFRLVSKLPISYYFSDWIQTHGNLYQAIKMSRKMIILLVLFIIIIAVFNVVSMLMMVVIDKRSDISVFRTQGARNSDIILIFLTQGFLIGVVGSLIGAIIGILSSLNAPVVINKIESFFEFNFLNSKVYPIDYLPSQLFWGDVILVVLVAIVLNLVVTIYPSLKAAKVNPAKELKYE